MNTSQVPELYNEYYGTERERQWYEVSSEDKARNVLRHCLPLNPTRVLDVGAGNGSVLGRYVAGGLGREVCAVEISSSGITELEERKSGTFVDVKKFDGITIPYPDDSFDLVVLSHVLEHVEHPRLLLHEMRRVARHAYIEVPLELSRLKGGLSGDWVMDDTGHINYYNRDLLCRQLQTAGWRVDQMEVSPPTVGTYRFALGTKGVVQWAVKRCALAFSTKLATSLFAFNCGVLCSRAPLPGVTIGLIEAKPREGGL